MDVNLWRQVGKIQPWVKVELLLIVTNKTMALRVHC